MSTLLAVSRPRARRLGSGSGCTLAAALVGFFVITLDAVVVNIALPPIRRELGGGMTGLQWIVDSYTLMFAALLLSAGALSDRAGARRAFAAGLTPFSARMAERVGARLLITTGLVLMAAGLAILAVVPPSAPVWVLAGLMVLVGLAGPLVMPPATAVLLNGIPGHRAGTASGVFNTSRQVGGALAVAVFGALLADRAAFMTGLRTSLLLAGGVALAAAAASRLLNDAQPGHRPVPP